MTDTNDLFGRIHALLLEGDIAPTPTNYEFLYRYVTGADPQLGAAFEAARGKGPVGERTLSAIRRDLYGSGRVGIGRVIEDTETQLARMNDYIERQDAGTRDYQERLGASRSDLDAAVTLDRQRAMLAEMIEATGAMLATTEQLQSELAASSREIDGLKADLEIARVDARSDSLTGLANRKACCDYLDAQIARAASDRQPLSLIFLDIDHFKKFNDSYGHRVGDEVLRLVSASLESFFHGRGFVSRWGGEEFVIVMPRHGAEEATAFAERFRQHIGTRTVRTRQSGQEIGRVTMSLGRRRDDRGRCRTADHRPGRFRALRRQGRRPRPRRVLARGGVRAGQPRERCAQFLLFPGAALRDNLGQRSAMAKAGAISVMLLALALLLDLAAAPASPCAPATVQPALDAAFSASQAKDLAGAKAAIASAATCPVKDGPTYGAHILRATIAAAEQDWSTAHAMLGGLNLHPESGPLGARAAFLQLRVDQAVGDQKRFAADRATILATNEARLLAFGGHKRESFAVPGGTVAAYDAPVDQGSFHRVYEFVATPTDPEAYPVTIQLTDDRGALSLQSAIAKNGSKPIAHVWFLDLYTCDRQATLPPPRQPTGDQPGYDEIKARVVATFADPKLLAAAPPPDKSACPTAMWILPGFSQQRKAD